MTKARDLANSAAAFSAVSATELGYVDGVTSAIQTQLDAKVAKTLTSTTGDIIYASAANTPARLGIGSSAQVLTVASGVPSWAAASSSPIKQIVYATKDTTVTNTNAYAYVDTGLTATITPSSASSTILIFINHNALFRTSNAGQIIWQVYRDATQIYTTFSQMYSTVSQDIEGTLTLIRKDSPATTSAITYKTQFRPSSSGGTVTVQSDNFPSSMTLMELA